MSSQVEIPPTRIRGRGWERFIGGWAASSRGFSRDLGTTYAESPVNFDVRFTLIIDFPETVL
jgi:hypothetical protein